MLGELVDDAVAEARHAAASAMDGCAPTGCEWYHGIWPTLRALGMVASPDRHRRFFTLTLAAARPAAAPRILVSGAADGAMVTEVIRARPDARVTVADRCATAVDLAVAAGRRNGIGVGGEVVDLLDPALDIGRFDVIVTHGLFGMTPADDRPALAAAWTGLLAPGGRLVTTTNIGQPGVTRPSAFTADAGRSFAARAGSLAQSMIRARGEEALGRSAADIEEAALAWSQRAVADPVGSVDDVRALLTSAGLETAIETRDISGVLAAGASGPWSSRSGRYAHIVATAPRPEPVP